MKKSDTADTVVFSVRWPRWLMDRVDEACMKSDRTRNWMIKKTMAQAIGGRIPDKPSEDDDV